MKLMNKISQFKELTKTPKGLLLLSFLLFFQGFTWGQTVSLDTVNPGCTTADGSVTITLSGYSSNYSYEIYDSTGVTLLFNNSNTSSNTHTFSNLDALKYIIKVYENNTTLINSYFISLKKLSLVLVSKTVVTCYNGSDGVVTLSGLGGTKITSTNDYDYNVNNGTWQTTGVFSSLTNGTYNFGIKDNNGCTAYQSITVTQNPIISAVINSKVDVKCKGGSDGIVTFLVTGGVSSYQIKDGSAGTYQSSTTFNNLSAGSHTFYIKDSKGCEVNKSTTINEPASAVSVILSTENITCHGLTDGKASLVPYGGTPNYTCQWTGTGSVSSFSDTSRSIKNLAAGTYNYTMTDNNGCTKTGQAKIVEPDTIAITPTITDVTCNGANTGGISLSITGGSPVNSPTYTYSWTGPSYSSSNKDITGLGAGTYTIQVSDNNSCKKSLTIDINEPKVISIKDSTIQVTCNGLKNGEIYLKVKGGIGKYTYLWNDANASTTKDIIALGAGIYTVTITDSLGCSKSFNDTVKQPDILTVDSTVTNLTCYKNKSGEIKLTIKGGTVSYNYSWTGPNSYTNTVDKDVSNLGAGTYKVVVTDNNNCTDTSIILVSEPTKITSIDTSENVLCHGSNEGKINLTVAGGTIATSYTFHWDGPNSFTAATEDIANLKAGDYIVNILDDNNCELIDTITITEPTTLSTTFTTYAVCEGDGSITFDGLGGTKPYTHMVDNVSSTSPKTNLPDKIYSIITIDSNNCIDSTKVNLTHVDGILPTLNVNNITVYLDKLGSDTIKTADINNGSTDNCGIDTLYLNKYTFTCSNLGVDTVILYAKDKNGNINSKKATVTVLDTISPIITVKNAIILIDTSGTAKLFETEVVVTKSDNCSVDTVKLSKNVFSLAELGANSVIITITDKSGNTVKKSVVVTVVIGDTDNDSIPDHLEKNVDTDKDGILDYADVDSDNDGIYDVVENEGLKTLVDFDSDGRPNYLDLDSDNDGVNDVLEADGIDNNKDGIKDDLTYFTSKPNNEDATGKPDYLDLDSDDDGLFDAYESQQKYVDADNNGIIDGNDTDGDGIVDNADGSTAWGDDTDVKPVDTDKDLKGDWRDLDSDGDLIPDDVELIGDKDADGIPNYVDLDSDGDLIPDSIEAGSNPKVPVKTDSDSDPDYLDFDSDNDLIPDSLEAGKNPKIPVDTDGDKTCDYLDLDSDNDGISDVEENESQTVLVDFDNDTRPNYIDLDSDNDGINDLIEAEYNYVDVNQDGIKDDLTYMATVINNRDLSGKPDYLDLDSDDDGLLDAYESQQGYTDANKDGVIDGVDTDGDGIVDNADGSASYGDANDKAPANTDGDSLGDWRDADSDDDEISDYDENGKDLNNNGIPDYIEAEVTIPEGFSPNNDNENDKLVIKGLKVFKTAEIIIFNRNGQIVYESGQGYKNNWDGTNSGSNPSFGTTQLPEGIYFYVFKFNGQNRQPISGNIYIKP